MIKVSRTTTSHCEGHYIDGKDSVKRKVFRCTLEDCWRGCRGDMLRQTVAGSSSWKCLVKNSGKGTCVSLSATMMQLTVHNDQSSSSRGVHQ